MTKPWYFRSIVKLGTCLVLSIFLSCEEEFKIDIPSDVANGIVFRGIISNALPPYFFQLVKPDAMSAEYRTSEGIEDAVVVIEDVTAGIKDTLQLLKPYFGEYVGVHYDYYNYHTKKNITDRVGTGEKNRSRGVYVTTKIYGIEGHTYTLDIFYKGKHHTARETMPFKTLMRDLKVKRLDMGTGKSPTWAPCISFTNQPDVDNYYLFNFHEYSTYNFPVSTIYSLFRGFDRWRYSILSDEHLSHEVVDLVISDGEDVIGLPPGASYPGSSDSIFVVMHAISKACYDIYDKTIEHVRTDGGAYTPTPTSVTGNISGNVWGCFQVSAYSEIGIYKGPGD